MKACIGVDDNILENILSIPELLWRSMEDDITSNELNHSEFLFFLFFRMTM